tara:strand:+ start:1031 stop:3682 length:2652 start_codon:yes stop_codon:yes gene_type:complete
MSEDVIAETDTDWFDNHLRDWADSGWETEEIENYLVKNSATATEALMRVEYLIGACKQLSSRMSHKWLERIDISGGLFSEWIEALNNPMNYDAIVERYNEWARQYRRWELILDKCRRDWEAIMLGEERLLILARCDALDESSKPRINLLIPMMEDPDSFATLDNLLSEIEENEARQKRAVYASIESLRSDGYDVEYIAEMNLVEALQEIGHRQKMHNLHEIIRLQIIDEIAEFDDQLAEKYEIQRKTMLYNDAKISLTDLSEQVSAMGLDLKKRLSKINLQIADWIDSGIVFSTTSIAAKDMFEWETNLPELTSEVNAHLALISRYTYYNERMNDVTSAQQYVGYLDQTDTLAEIVDDLELRWKDAELECYSIIEKYQNLGLIMDDWGARIDVDPLNSLTLIKITENDWQNRLNCIDQLLEIDVSFDGKIEVEKRIDLLREVEAGPEVIEDTVSMIERMITRRARHRMLLEKDLMQLIADGKASEDTASSTFSLAEFEGFVAQSRKHGSSANASITGNSIIGGRIGERIKEKIGHELNLFESAGWYINELNAMFEDDPLRVARLLSSVRGQMNEHDALRRRLSTMPWNRNVTLALQLQEEMRNPLKLAKINKQIPAMMKELAQMPIEDEDFVFHPWSPAPIRKTLLPIPEQVLEPVDALGDAHEAMLESMESEVLVVDEEIEAQQEELVDEQSPSSKQDIEEEVQQKLAPKSAVSNSTDIEHLHIIMNKLGLNDSYERQDAVAEQVQQIRRSLAKNVGLEPRDIRVDRLLRLILRLLPQSNEQDGRRKLLIMKLATGLKRYKNWIKRRLEARHKAAKDSLILDSITLGNALQRIPGPGFKVPLQKDEKKLPGFDEIEELSAEVEVLLSTLNLDSASGVVVSAQ